jgi:flagellar motor protein MotB
MSPVETVRRDARSYREGLVLGLTMAEVFLLLLFALLIALAALWNSEHQERKALDDHRGQPNILSDADRRLLDEAKAAVAGASPDSVTKALNDLRNGRQLEPLTGAEQKFVVEVRGKQSGAAPEAISDQWRQLTRAAGNPKDLGNNLDVAEDVNRALPDEKDRKRVGGLIEKGLASEKKGEHDWPPIINVSDAKDCFFETGKAELTPCFETKLRTKTVPQLLELAELYGVKTIEVIGHTDEQKIIQRNSNLDTLLLDVLRHTGNVSNSGRQRGTWIGPRGCSRTRLEFRGTPKGLHLIGPLWRAIDRSG